MSEAEYHEEIPPAGTIVFARIDTDGWCFDNPQESTAQVVVKLHDGKFVLVDITGGYLCDGCMVMADPINENHRLYKTQLDAIKAGVELDRAYNKSMDKMTDAVAEAYGIGDSKVDD